MDFSTLTPSVAPLTGSEPINREPGQAKRLTVLLAAGASRFAGAPSTKTLTDAVSQRPLCRQILDELRTSSEFDANFEDILQVLEDLDDFYAHDPPRSAAMLRKFIALVSPVWTFFAKNRSAGREERLGAIEAIADAFADIDYDRHWRTLYELFRPFFRKYDIDVFTLNYDLVADCSINALAALSGKKYFTGFGTGPVNMDGSEAFRPDQYANPQWELNLTLAHIHGSLAYAYNPGNRAMAYADPLDIVEAQTIRLARKSWDLFHNQARAEPEFTFGGKAPIISGLHKLEKINSEPYANYFHGFVQAISKSPYLLIIGYGLGDEHINYWLKESSLMHLQKQRVIEITDNTDPSRFVSQKFGAYDLNWHQQDDNLFHSDAGAFYLTYTGGLLDGTTLPTEKFLEFLAS